MAGFILHVHIALHPRLFCHEVRFRYVAFYLLYVTDSSHLSKKVEKSFRVRFYELLSIPMKQLDGS